MSKYEIRNIGSYLFCDTEGYLIDDNINVQIQRKWLIPVKQIVNLICNNIESELVSIYLRGSVARQCAIDNISDIDIFVITNQNISVGVKKLIMQSSNDLLICFPYVTRVDIGFHCKHIILKAKEKILIKYRSYLLYGENLRNQIPSLKPGNDTAVTLTRLENELCKLSLELRKKIYNEGNSRLTCRWLAKRIVRSGFELVAYNEKLYTRDLYKCWEMFSKYYPQYKERMFYVLNLAINPTNKVDDIAFMCNFGEIILILWKTIIKDI